MGLSIDQILPSIQLLGVFGYWIIAAASMLEAYYITGVVVSGIGHKSSVAGLRICFTAS